MRIVVFGGSSGIGSNVVSRLRRAGHAAAAAPPRTDVDACAGEELAKVLAGAEVVIDAADAPSLQDESALRFSAAAEGRLLAAEKAAGVRHHLALSVVGADRLPESGYLRARRAQEVRIEASGIPYGILRSTQCFESLPGIIEAGADGDVVRLSPAFVQPVAADDVASALAELAVAAPVNGIVEIAGPEKLPLDVVARDFLEARQDRLEVVADAKARCFGVILDDRSLTPGKHPRIGATPFGDWLETIRPKR